MSCLTIVHLCWEPGLPRGTCRLGLCIRSKDPPWSARQNFLEYMKAFKLLSTPGSWRLYNVSSTHKLVRDSKVQLAYQCLLWAAGTDTPAGLLCVISLTAPRNCWVPVTLEREFGMYIKQSDTSPFNCLSISASHRPSQSRTEWLDNDGRIFHVPSQMLQLKPWDESISGLITAFEAGWWFSNTDDREWVIVRSWTNPVILFGFLGCKVSISQLLNLIFFFSYIGLS